MQYYVEKYRNCEHLKQGKSQYTSEHFFSLLFYIIDIYLSQWVLD